MGTTNIMGWHTGDDPVPQGPQPCVQSRYTNATTYGSITAAIRMSKNLPATTEHFTILQFRKAMLDFSGVLGKSRTCSSTFAGLHANPLHYEDKTKPPSQNPKNKNGVDQISLPPRSGKPDLLGGFTSQIRDAV